MNSFHISIHAADRAFYEGECESLTIPTSDGSMGILAYHSNMIGAVIPGILKYRAPDEEEVVAAVSAGLVKVEANDVLVLVDTIELPEEIDENRAKRAAAEAKEEMLKKRSREEYLRAQAEMSRAIIRLKVKNSTGKYK